MNPLAFIAGIFKKKAAKKEEEEKTINMRQLRANPYAFRPSSEPPDDSVLLNAMLYQVLSASDYPMATPVSYSENGGTFDGGGAASSWSDSSSSCSSDSSSSYDSSSSSCDSSSSSSSD